MSRGDFFLEAALADDPSVQLSVAPPAGYRAGMERGYDLVIFDGFLPPALPTNSTLLVAPPAGRSGPLRFAGALTAGAVNAASAGPLAGLLQYVDLGDVHVAQVRAVTLPGWMQPLATSNGHPVLAAGEEGTARFALVSFDLQHSDWPLRVSFPIMLQNLLQYLAPGLTLGQTTITTGQAVTFFPRPGTRALEVVRPDGGVDQLKPPFPPFTDTSRPGLYTVQEAGAGTATAGRQHSPSTSSPRDRRPRVGRPRFTPARFSPARR